MSRPLPLPQPLHAAHVQKTSGGEFSASQRCSGLPGQTAWPEQASTRGQSALGPAFACFLLCGRGLQGTSWLLDSLWACTRQSLVCVASFTAATTKPAVATATTRPALLLPLLLLPLLLLPLRPSPPAPSTATVTPLPWRLRRLPHHCCAVAATPALTAPPAASPASTASGERTEVCAKSHKTVRK